MEPFLRLLREYAISVGINYNDVHLVLYALLLLIPLCALLVLALLGVARRVYPPVTRGTVAFFHPFANDGGGGERVLWVAIHALQQARPDLRVAIYVAGEDFTPVQLCEAAESRFNVRVDPSGISLVPLSRTRLLTPAPYPRLTLLGQAAGSLVVASEAMSKLVPEVFVDTVGCSFTFPLARLLGSRVACYVHYPTISMDMLRRVREREVMYNNDEDITASQIKSWIKAAYYWVFSVMYGYCGSLSHVVMVNSSWTRAHVEELFGAARPLDPIRVPLPYTLRGISEVSLPRPDWRRLLGIRVGSVALVYPPCDTSDLQKLPLDRKLKRPYIVSVAQFRPEKNHELQLRAYARARSQAEADLRQAAAGVGASSGPDLSQADDGELEGRRTESARAVLQSRLLFIGSCRNKDDEGRVESLKTLANQLGITEEVEFLVNLPYSDLRAWLGEAVCGLHSMVDEHFGISVVEYMASGLVPIANNSGGPRSDIVGQGAAGVVGREWLSDNGGDGVTSPRQRVGSQPGDRTRRGTGGPRGIEISTDGAPNGGHGGVGRGDGGGRVGLLASTESEYATAIRTVLGMSQHERMAVAASARCRADNFSNERFEAGFISCLTGCLPQPAVFRGGGAAGPPPARQRGGRA